MSDDTDRLLQRVQTIMPGLEIEHYERDQEGLINDVLIVNNQFVFRFAKTEKFARLLDVEMKILDLIRPNIGVSVPTPVYRSSDCVVYPFLSGQPLSLKLVMGLDESMQNNIAEQIGIFLYSLHTTEIANIDWELPATRAG
jgi:aminoglycoside 2''-phosphotransferase